MEILFDSLPLDHTGEEFNIPISTSSYILILPINPLENILDQIVVIFDMPLTTTTTVRIDDGVVFLTVIVSSGNNYGVVSYTPTSAGIKTFNVSHTGQSGITDPTTNLTITVMGNSQVSSLDPEDFLEKPRGVKYLGYTNQFVEI